MLKAKFIPLILLLAPNVYAIDPSFKFEGVCGCPVENINNMNHNAQAFLPYNPVILEIGAYKGAGTINLAETYPYGKIFAFEPQPAPYSALSKALSFYENVTTVNLAINVFNGIVNLWGKGATASLLNTKSRANSKICVNCVKLDDWCYQNNIDRVDFVRLDVGGLEKQILESSPKIFEKIIVISTKTYLNPKDKSAIPYIFLKNWLNARGFQLLSHWYKEKEEGEAIFVRQYMYDSIFK